MIELAAKLGLSLRDRNALLEAGGFARQYGERSLSSPEIAGAKRAIDLLLSRHAPFPAIVTDRQWTVIETNGAAACLLNRKPGLGTGVVKALAKQLDANVVTLSGALGTKVSVTHARFAAA